MRKFFDRVTVAISTTGTGDVTFGAADSGKQTPSDAGAADGDVMPYVIEDGTDWEEGDLTIGGSATTGARSVNKSTNSNTALNLSGNATLFCDAKAADLNAALDYGLVTGAVTGQDDYGSVA